MTNQEKAQQLIDTVTKSILELRLLKTSDTSLRTGYCLSVASLMNAYREGDIGFADAVEEISKLSQPAIDGCNNMLGAFDTPLTRLQLGKQWTEFHEECCESARRAVNR